MGLGLSMSKIAQGFMDQHIGAERERLHTKTMIDLINQKLTVIAAGTVVADEMFARPGFTELTWAKAFLEWSTKVANMGEDIVFAKLLRLRAQGKEVPRSTLTGLVPQNLSLRNRVLHKDMTNDRLTQGLAQTYLNVPLFPRGMK